MLGYDVVQSKHTSRSSWRSRSELVLASYPDICQDMPAA